MYQEDITLTDTSDPVTSINFSYPGGNRVVVYGLSGQAIPVPEPATWALLGAGVAVLLIRRRLASPARAAA